MLFLTSCQATYGERYNRGNLEVYYTEEMKSYVIPTANYFEDNDLIREDKKHSIQLTSSKMDSENPSMILKMIVSDSEQEPPVYMDDHLDLLEADLKTEVFKGANFRIEVCNENFIEIK
ncbi:MAG: hypothetical protein WDZ35_13640 [Crocinitomicaceae bacterium]